MSEFSTAFPESLEIIPLSEPPHTSIQVPGSKSISNRALVLGALTEPGSASNLRGILQSEDTEIMVNALRCLGFSLETFWPECRVHVGRPYRSEVIPASTAELFVANSGTTMRFLTALVCLGRGVYRLDGIPRMRERPIGDLVAALGQLGADVRSEGKKGYPPVLVEAAGLSGGHVKIKGDTSSQFLSGLLMAASLAEGDTTVEVEGFLVSRSYVEMTLAMMCQFGARAQTEGVSRFRIAGRNPYRPLDYSIEPDASAASYFFAAAAITGGTVRVEGLGSHSLQGDARFVDILEAMGSRVERGTHHISVEGKGLKGIEIDMNDVSDCVMTLGAVACFADGPTTIRNVAHIRHKETDRLSALATELRGIGATVIEKEDGLEIIPGRLHGTTVETYNDHRMAMSLSVVGLRVPGICIRNPGCVAKTYPTFFNDLKKLQKYEDKQ